MSLRNLWTLSAAAVLFSGCYFWTDPPFPDDATEDTGSGSETEDVGTQPGPNGTDTYYTDSESLTDTESIDTGTGTGDSETGSETVGTGTETQDTEDTGSESIDTGTEDTGTADSDSQEPQCTSGVCCDMTTNTFEPSTFPCDSIIEYRCQGSGCGADVQERTVMQYCSGSSNACNGEVVESDWTTAQECGSDELCKTDRTNHSACTQCPNGCRDGACCDCKTGDCCDGCKYRPSSYACEIKTDYRCYGSGCGAEAQKRTVSKNCSGTSAYCNGETTEEAWTTAAACALDEVCETDNSKYADCEFDFGCDCENSGNWYDPSSRLCWQDPPSDSQMNWYRASGTYHADDNPDTVYYCGQLDAGGHSDWRLPNIDELISLIRGCEDGTATEDLSTSLCEMTPDGCAETNSCTGTSHCSYCSSGDGPASGCYWDPAFGASYYMHWSSSVYAQGTIYAWFVNYYSGLVDAYGKSYNYRVRCVRSEP